MAHQYSVAVQNAQLDAFDSTVASSAKLQIWNDGGAGRPTNCAAAATGTKLVEMSLPSTWMAAASGNSVAKSGSWTGTGLADAGAGTEGKYARITDSAGTTCHFQCAVHPAGTDWAISTAYALNAYAYANGSVYKCTTAGTSASSGTGPSGTGTGITDGTAVWDYVSDIGIGLDNTSIASGQTVTISSFTLSRGNS